MLKSMIAAFSFRQNFSSIFHRSRGNIPALDGLRALSILWVLTFHVYILTSLSFSPEAAQQLLRETPWFFNWIWNGDKGVDIFFVMSGFLISGLLFQEHQKTNTLNLKRFYIRRFLRLTPVYWFTLIVYVLLNGPNSDNAWANFIYVNNFLPSSEMAMTWTWSLAVEEQFYLIAPLFLLLVLWKSKHKVSWLVGLLIISLLIRLALLLSEPELASSDMRDIFNLEKSDKFDLYFDRMYADLHTRFGPFICGILASYWYFYYKSQLSDFFSRTISKPVVLVGFLLVIGFALAPSYHQEIAYSRLYQTFYLVTHRTLFAIGITILLLAALFPSSIIGRVFNKILSLKFWVPIAHLSYSIYIFHIFVVGWVHINIKANLKASGAPYDTIDFYWALAATPISLLVSCIFASILYVCIEKPFMNLRNAFRDTQKEEGNSPARRQVV